MKLFSYFQPFTQNIPAFMSKLDSALINLFKEALSIKRFLLFEGN